MIGTMCFFTTKLDLVFNLICNIHNMVFIAYITFVKKNLKTLWPLFMDGVQLPQG